MGPLWIVIPTRDRHEALAAQMALLGAEARKLKRRRVEIVVSDDASTPPVRIDCGRRTRLVRSETPRGPNAARDAAIRPSPADAVIVEIDDHDPVEPGALREIDRAFRAGAFLAFGDFRRVNSRGEAARVEPVVGKGKYAPWRFREEGALHVGMRAYRRTLYDEVGGYRHDEFPAGDYALMLRMEARLRGRGIVAIPKVLCSVVTSARGISVRCAKEQ
ncbi:MAG: glycosyltransferase family 2 protein, partial [Planctomycetota bacterium]